MPISADFTFTTPEKRKDIVEQYIENIQKDIEGLQLLKQSDWESRVQPNTDLVRRQNETLTTTLHSLKDEDLSVMGNKPYDLFNHLRPFDEIADWTLPMLSFKINHYRNLALSEGKSLEALKILPVEHLKDQSHFIQIYEDKIELLKGMLGQLDRRVPTTLVPPQTFPSHSIQAKLIFKIKRINEAVGKSKIVQMWIDGRELGVGKYVKDGRRDEPVIFELNVLHAQTCEVHFVNKNTRRLEKFISIRLSWLEDYFKSPQQVDRKFVGRLELVPSGSMDVEISLSPADTVIKRSGAVIYPAVHELGHRLVPFSHNYLQTLRCAHCGDTTNISAWYQCENCRFLCHKNCVSHIYNRCLPNPNYAAHEALTEELQRNAQPHQFLQIKSAKGYCIHCGHSVTGGYKCSECHGWVHEECEVYVPSFCGLHRNDAIRIKEIFLEDPNTGGLLLQKKKSFRIVPEGNQDKIIPGWESFAEDDFEYISMIGKGNFGKVFLARVKRTGLLVALKVLKKSMIILNDEGNNIKAEKAVLALNAPVERSRFLLKCYGVFQSPTRLFFVMEYMGGGDLMHHIQQKIFTMEQVVFAAAEVLLALDFLHRQNIIYRDLKLDNILMSVDGHLKLADYGLCKLNMHSDSTTSTLCGTPEFIAPEVLFKKSYDRRVDWWGFGVLLYEMLFHRPPFSGKDDNDLNRLIGAGRYTIPNTATVESRDLIQKLLVVDPKKRLGGVKGAAEIKKHPFFNGVDFEKLALAGVKSPFRPNIEHPTDVGNFDAQFTMQPAELSPATSLTVNAEVREFFDCLVGDQSTKRR